MLDEKTVSSLTQGGAFMVLVAIVVWLMYWVPKWVASFLAARVVEDENRRKMVEVFSDAMKAISTAHNEAVCRAVDSFRSEMTEERKSCEKRSKDDRDAGERRHGELIAEITAARESNEGLHKTLDGKLTVASVQQEFNRQLIEEIGVIKRAGRAKQPGDGHEKQS